MTNSFFIFVFILASLSCVSSVVNKDVQRIIDASSSILKIFIDIKAADVDKEYQIVFPTSAAKKLAFLSVQQKGKSLVVQAPVESGNRTVYNVLVSDSNPTLKVEAVFTDMLEPYPAEITQNEGQFVRFSESHYFLSPYQTENQRTTVKLASNGIESFTPLTPSSARGSVITFGPYKSIAPLTKNTITLPLLGPRRAYGDHLKEEERRLYQWPFILLSK